MTPLVQRIVALCLAGAATVATAHELGTIEVQARFGPGSVYRIDVPFDEPLLLQRLQLADGSELTAEPTLEQARFGIEERLPLVLEGVRILADQQTVEPQVELREVRAANGALGTVMRLSGELPEGSTEVRFAWDHLATRYVVRARVVDLDEEHLLWVDPEALSDPVPLRHRSPPALSRTLALYLGLGFTHILPKGLDHILFVLGLFLLSARWRPLLAQVTAFTVAHTATLGLSIYGVVSLPSAVVEPLIALSIVYVALENLATETLRRSRVAVVFAFGLLHGLGFAGVLRELGLPDGQLLPALLAFNVGVELGQLAVLAAGFALLASWGRQRRWYRRLVVVPGSLAIAGVGMFWTVQRVLLVG